MEAFMRKKFFQAISGADLPTNIEVKSRIPRF